MDVLLHDQRGRELGLAFAELADDQVARPLAAQVQAFDEGRGHAGELEHDVGAAGNVPTSAIMKEVDELAYSIKTSISQLTQEQLHGEYPLKDGKPAKITVERLIQLFGHLQYHIGQINYHRRLLEAPVSIQDGIEKLEKRR